jgi:hypothetical protein
VGFDDRARPVAPVSFQEIPVVADLVGLPDAIAASATRLTRNRTHPATLEGAGCVAPVSAHGQAAAARAMAVVGACLAEPGPAGAAAAVIALLAGLTDSVAAAVARCARRGAGVGRALRPAA